jgi:antitoxin YefM
MRWCAGNPQNRSLKVPDEDSLNLQQEPAEIESIGKRQNSGVTICTECCTVVPDRGGEIEMLNTDRRTEGSATLPITEIRDRLSEIIDDVNTSGTEWTITRHGRPVAVILGAEDYEALIESLNILSDDDVMSALDEADADIAAGRVSEG